MLYDQRGTSVPSKRLDYEALKATVKKKPAEIKPKKAKTRALESVEPVVKWAGGKRKLLKEILPKVPASIDTYFEPFFGGGAVFFSLVSRGVKIKHAVLNDMNADLMETYQVIASPSVHDLIALLQTYPHTREFYDHLRRIVPRGLHSATVRAARFLYLNRTGFNGLYRVNRKGEFNVPFGKYSNPTICDVEALLRVNKALQGVELISTDFATCVAPAKAGDFVYFDPPYLPISETSSFTAYTAGGFPLADHRRLATTFFDLGARGVSAVLSNSTAANIRTLYGQDPAVIQEVLAPRSINSDGTKRGYIGELLISIGVSPSTTTRSQHADQRPASL